MRTFKFADDKSYKFWNIELGDTSYTVTFGKIGTKGQTQTKEFANAAAARAAYEKIIAEKVGKGYAESTAASAPATPDLVLERALRDDPDDEAAHAAYADWLAQQGDPRGEFIQVQLALEDPKTSSKDRKELQKRERNLLQAHESEWVGEWASLAQSTGPEGRGQVDFLTPKFRFIKGILAEVTIDALSAACARAFILATQTRLVRHLSIGGWAYEEHLEGDQADDEADEDGGYYPGQNIFYQWPYFDNLRAFQLGWTCNEVYGDFCDFQCHLRAPRIVKLIERMPRLEQLYLFADSVPTAQLFRLKTLNHLQVLQVYHCWEYPLEILAQNPAFKNLKSLLLHPKASGAWTEEPAPYIKAEGVKAVLNSPHLQNLTHLRLRLTDLGDAGCEEIVRSGILRRLKNLDLRHGSISDAGAHILAACPDLKNLEALDLSRNQLTARGIKELKGVVKTLEADHQNKPENIASGEYLFQGDYE